MQTVKDWVLLIIVLIIVTIDLLLFVIGTAIPESRMVALKSYDSLHDTASVEYKVIKGWCTYFCYFIFIIISER